MRRMATVGERLATLEEQMRGVREDVASIHTEIGDNRSPGSIRYRLHQLEGLALMREGLGRLLGRGWKITAGVALLAAAAAPYVIFFATR